MELIIDFDDFQETEPQTLSQYNYDLEVGDIEIESGKFITAEELKIEACKW